MHSSGNLPEAHLRDPGARVGLSGLRVFDDPE
jgi:hypothetical protein